jgi:hypothetical protein
MLSTLPLATTQVFAIRGGLALFPLLRGLFAQWVPAPTLGIVSSAE